MDPRIFHIFDGGGDWEWHLPSGSDTRWRLEGPFNFHQPRRFAWLPGAFRSAPGKRIEIWNVAGTAPSGARVRGPRSTAGRDHRWRWPVRARTCCTIEV